MKLASAWFRIPFWQRVVAGFVLGAIVGSLMGPAAETWFGPLGDLYVTLIKMIAIPLVFFAVINAISALHGQKSVAALGGRTFLWFVITAVIAVLIGLGLGTLFKPGAGGLQIAIDSAWKPRDVPSPIRVLLDVVPSNPFFALAGIGTKVNAAGETVLAAGRGSILPVIFFAALLGFAIVKLGDKVAGARKLFNELGDIMVQVTRFVLEVTPIGTFGLIAALVGGYGWSKLLPLGNFILVIYLACAIQIVVVYGALLLMHGLNPLKFFRGAAPGMQVAFATSSSFAALPIALRSITHNLGVNKDYAAFASPLGASIKMDGCGAIYPALCAVFISQYMGVPISFNQYLIIIIASVLGSFGTAGVPGTAVVMATVVLSAAGLPLEAIGYLYAIDRIVDMMRTLTNVTGQMVVPVLVAKETGLLDQQVYDAAPTNVGIEHGKA
ncbi:dicarboxylate/amino acid:cation symporter [Pseudoxanthomonas composti]|uniref:Dicarboxylate/amino acid:cation symporter n=1 Tax=Pseudoxanthomonas composti TaxID=2137479 RepID=A0A4Q1JVY0_9GAMM|nr:dicarboxylate/amino acid:cation symporter [Pseudoxanthomonas composti]RXR05359.1 dicarboxylate/amino acid:cation symporter [Pseudoxanthomonas composti]